MSPAPSGVLRDPTFSVLARVSSSLHGVIVVSTDAVGDAAEAVRRLPAPIEMATAAPMAAQRARCCRGEVMWLMP